MFVGGSPVSLFSLYRESVIRCYSLEIDSWSSSLIWCLEIEATRFCLRMKKKKGKGGKSILGAVLRVRVRARRFAFGLTPRLDHRRLPTGPGVSLFSSRYPTQRIIHPQPIRLPFCHSLRASSSLSSDLIIIRHSPLVKGMDSFLKLALVPSVFDLYSLFPPPLNIWTQTRLRECLCHSRRARKDDHSSLSSPAN